MIVFLRAGEHLSETTPLKIGEGLIIFMDAGARGAHELLLAKSSK